MVDDTHLSRWVERDGRLDHAHEYLAQFKRYIPEGGTVIDCGTSIGDHTVTYAQYVGHKGTVIGFEASADVAECCALNLAIYPTAQIYNVGLSDDYGVAGMEVSDNSGASCLNTKEGRSVHLSPLDPYTQDLKRVDFIKVDIEGFEVRMLKGAKDTFRRFRPTLLMEINEGALLKQGFKPKDVFDVIKSYGYEFKVIDGAMGSSQYEILARKV